jgi:hypothetical protein
VTANLSRPPERIVVTAESIETPDDADWWITGLKRHGDGYARTTLREDPTPGFCRMHGSERGRRRFRYSNMKV